MRFDITEDTPLFKVKEQLDKAIEGHEEAKIALLFALLSKEHIYLEGLQGSGKTLLAETCARSMQLNFFFYQVYRDMRFSQLTEGDLLKETKMTDPGMRDIAREVITKFESEPHDGGILRAEIVVLDDITRTPGESLNVLLRIMNERKFQAKDIPLITMIATSNPTILSEGKDAFNPMYYNEPLDPAHLDRFLIHCRIESYTERQKFDKGAAILKKASADYHDTYIPQQCMQRKDLKLLQEQLHTITVPEEVLYLLRKVYEKIFDPNMLKDMRNVVLSDRTFFKKIIKILRASAMIAGRNECTSEDIFALRFITAFRLPQIHPHIEKIIASVIAASKEKASELKQPQDKTKQEFKDNQPANTPETNDTFRAPKKKKTSSPKENGKPAESSKDENDSTEENESEPQSIEINTSSDTIEQGDDDLFLAINPDAIEEGKGENITLKGGIMEDHIKGINDFLRDIASGSRKGSGKDAIVQTGGIPRDWQALRDWSDIDQVHPIDLAFEHEQNLRIPKKKEKKGDVIAILRDISTSMSENGAEVASRINNAILAFAEYHRLPLLYLTFHSEPELYLDNNSIITRNYKYLMNESVKTDVSGATNYQKALHAFLQATTRFYYIKNFHLIITGDGNATAGDIFATSEIRELQKRRIRAYPIYTKMPGYFSQKDDYPSLFKKLVKETGGQAYEAVKNASWHLQKRTDIY